jgi:TfoX/Sxy family transcriptional regulator of competence genes
MTWKPAPPEMISLFARAIQAVPQAEPRKMFGYPAAFANGYMFAGLHQDSFVLKLSTADFAAFLQLPGARPFEPMPGRTMTGFVSVPPALFDTPTLTGWLLRAHSFALALPPKPPRARPSRPAKP